MSFNKYKIIKYLLLIFTIYITLQILIKLINLYNLLFLALLLFMFYIINRKLFKKIIYKLIYQDRKNRFIFRNKFTAAKRSLEGIAEINNKITNKVNYELLNYERNRLEIQLKVGDYNVILFGTGTSGKTSIARSLLKSIIGKTSPTIGTTKEITSYKINIPILKRNINIIDTPGLFEASKEGKERERLTISKATNSDLILFVLDQDINKYELYLIKELLKIEKKIIIVLNKCDLRTKHENEIILENIKTITSSNTNNISVIKTIAIKSQSNNLNQEILNQLPEVNNLFREIIEILDNNGEELLADNILFRSKKLGIKSKEFISLQRNLTANKLINKYIWITAGIILLNPLPAVDFLTATSVNVQMIIELSKIYEVQISRKKAVELSKSLISTIAKLGILKYGISNISTTLASSFTTIFIAKSVQSITSGWLIRIVGLSLIKYFKNGQDWGDGGIQQVVENVYKLNRREEVLNEFINEAVKKIQIKNRIETKKKLPPF